MIPPDQLEPIAMRAFPATQEESLGEWTLRSHTTLPNRRVNSAWDLGDPGIPMRDAIDSVEAWFRRRGKRPIVKTTEGSVADLHLDGWAVEAPTIVMTSSARDVPEPGVSILPKEQLSEWCRLFAQVRGFPESRAAGLEASYRHLDHLALAVISHGTQPTAVGLGVLDGRWMGLFDIAVAPDHRRQGLGSAITRALVNWGARRDAETAYLQVEADNLPAVTLYESLSFEPQYSYRYRVKSETSRSLGRRGRPN